MTKESKKPKTTSIDDLLKNSAAAEILDYGRKQMAITRETIMDWMSKIGQTQSIRMYNEDSELEVVTCETVNLMTSDYDEAFEEAPFYIKDVEIEARQATIPEIVIKYDSDRADVVANIGDWIVKNPNEEQPYVIPKEDFSSFYMPKEGEPGIYVSVGKPVKAIPTDRNIAFVAPWGQLQVVKSGGYILQNSKGERYGISRKLFIATYKKVTHLPMRFVRHTGQREEIPCRLVDLNSREYDQKFENATFFKKNVEVFARQATTLEMIQTELDATRNTASPGDWIVSNPGESPYVVAAEKFARLYVPKKGEENIFVSAGKPVKAVQVTSDIVFLAPWGELQAVRTGGYIIQGVEGERYGIDQVSFEKTYEAVEHLSMAFTDHEGNEYDVPCKMVDLHTPEYDQMFADAKRYRKRVEVNARPAEDQEVVYTDLDATHNTARLGDWIVHNPGEKPYVIRGDQFKRLYRPKEGVEGIYVSVGRPVKRARIAEDIVFIAPWKELQAVQAGGSILENEDGERYGISEQSFIETYEPVE